MNWLRREVPEKKKGFFASTGPITGSFSLRLWLLCSWKRVQPESSRKLFMLHEVFVVVPRSLQRRVVAAKPNSNTSKLCCIFPFLPASFAHIPSISVLSGPATLTLPALKIHHFKQGEKKHRRTCCHLQLKPAVFYMALWSICSRQRSRRGSIYIYIYI